MTLELMRRDAAGNLVPWAVNNDGTEPTADQVAREKLEAIRTLLGIAPAQEATLRALRDKDFATQTTLLLALNKLNDIFGAVDGLEITAGNIDISNTTIGLQTDEVEALLRAIRDTLTTEDFASEVTLAALLGRAPVTGIAADTTLQSIRDTLMRRTDPIPGGGNIIGFTSPSPVLKVLQGKVYRVGADVVTSVTTPNASMWALNPSFLADGVTPNTKTLYLIGIACYADAAAPVTFWEDATSTGTLLVPNNMLTNATDTSVAEVRAGTSQTGGAQWSARSRVAMNSPVVREVFVVLPPGKSLAIRFNGPGATNTVTFNATWYEE